MNEQIETGVDKFINLVRQSQSISLAAATSELKLDSKVVKTWAEFLEEEGILKIKYTFRGAIVSVTEKAKLQDSGIKMSLFNDGQVNKALIASDKKTAKTAKKEDFIRTYDKYHGIEQIKLKDEDIKKELRNKVETAKLNSQDKGAIIKEAESKLDDFVSKYRDSVGTSVNNEFTGHVEDIKKSMEKMKDEMKFEMDKLRTDMSELAFRFRKLKMLYIYNLQKNRQQAPSEVSSGSLWQQNKQALKPLA